MCHKFSFCFVFSLGTTTCCTTSRNINVDDRSDLKEKDAIHTRIASVARIRFLGPISLTPSPLEIPFKFHSTVNSFLAAVSLQCFAYFTTARLLCRMQNVAVRERSSIDQQVSCSKGNYHRSRMVTSRHRNFFCIISQWWILLRKG